MDLDNTIHDYASTAQAARAALAARIEERCGVPRARVQSRYTELLDASSLGQFDSGRAARLARLAHLCGTWPETAEMDVVELANYLEEMMLENLLPFPDAPETLRSLRRYGRVVILTEGYLDTQWMVARRLGLELEPEEMVASHDHGVTKSDGSAHRVAADLLGLAPADLLMLGDNWTWDIVAAASAGLWQVWISSAEQEPGPAPRRYLGRIPSLAWVPEFLPQWRRSVRAASPG